MFSKKILHVNSMFNQMLRVLNNFSVSLWMLTSDQTKVKKTNNIPKFSFCQTICTMMGFSLIMEKKNMFNFPTHWQLWNQFEKCAQTNNSIRLNSFHIYIFWIEIVYLK